MDKALGYDAAIIGAGAEGLAAAAILGRAGLRVLVIERTARAGGRCVTREFHPGFRASPFADELAEIPDELAWTLDLARHGAIFAPRRFSLALWPDRRHALEFTRPPADPAHHLLAHVSQLRRSIASEALRRAGDRPTRWTFGRPKRECWPAEEWATATLADVLGGLEPDAQSHLAALALSQGVADPFVSGSALHLLGANAAGGRLAGGLGNLADALVAVAKEAGVEFSFGLEAADVQRNKERVRGVGLADGSEIETSSVISTLDLKRTFLAFFPWNALPRPLVRSVNAFRMAGGVARVLFALDRPPAIFADEAWGGPVHVAPSLAGLRDACQAWRAGVIADALPATVEVVSVRDPRLAPVSGAVVTVTLGGVPFRLFDGAWNFDKRELLRQRALRAAEFVSPGFAERVVGAQVVAPPDIEDGLGATEGDLTGGEIAGDQMLGFGPWDDPPLPRTPVTGLYVAGSHLTAGAFATCAAGAAAARALLADRGEGRFK